MKIQKRNGDFEKLSFDKITARLKKLANDKMLGKLSKIDTDVIAQKVVSAIYDGVSSKELDEEAARIAVSMIENPEFPKLASRIVVSSLHKSTQYSFSDVMEMLYDNYDKNGNKAPILSDSFIESVRKNKDALDGLIDYNRDYIFDYFGLKTLEKSYLMKKNGRVVERPQQMYMRVCVNVFTVKEKELDISKVKEMYDLLSNHYFTMASPTIFNSGSPLNNLASCFEENTIVATINRGPVKIKDVELGDEVITHLGNVKKVTQLHKNKLGNRKLFEIKTEKNEKIKVTDNHKLMTLNGWVSVSDLNAGDFIQEAKIGDVSLFLKLESKKEIIDDLPEYVYTLGVEDDHSYNVGGIIAQNCFLIGTDDSIDGMYKTMADCARISKVGGGIGVHISNVRAKGSVIRGTNGISDGIIPMIKVYNSVCSHVNQCILPGIRVYSKDGLKPVEEVTTNDYLMTSDGTFKKVNEVMVTEADVQEVNWKHKKIKKQKVLASIKEELESRGNEVTDEILELEFRRREDDEEQRLLRRQVMEFYTSADSKPLQCTSEHDIYIIPATKQNGYFKTRHQVRHKIKKPMFVEARKVKTHDLLGYPIPRDIIDFEDITEETCYEKGKSGDFADNEVSRYMNLPESKYYKLLQGIFESGVVEEKMNAFYLNTENSNLLELVRYLLMKIEVLPTFDNPQQMRFPKLEKYKTLGIYSDFTHQKRNNTYFKYDGFLWTKIKRIDKIKYTGKVYDFNMIDNHNYLTEHGLVHNSGRRKGSFAVYLEPHHADVLDFLELKRNQGHDDMRARDLFYAVWASDLFMKQVENDGDWYLMCPDECPNLNEVYGEEYEKLYWSYVEQGKYRKKIKAQEIWKKILDSQIETGVPYIGYKDAVNKKSNQKNIGTIKSSNLCVAPETMILTSTGYHQIHTLENKEVEVWNGEEWSKTVIRKTGENQELLKVTLSNGVEIECTPYHKFIIKDVSNGIYGRIVRAHDLSNGDTIIDYKLPVNKDSAIKKVNNIKITKVEYTGRKSDTYCFTESKRNMGIFNGVLLGNCMEIAEVSNKDDYAVCNLCSIALPKYVKYDKSGKPYFDHEELYKVAKFVTEPMNLVIDNTYYPTPETRKTNMATRPLAIGIQGLHSLYMKMRLPFESEEAKKLNKEVFETLYYGCVEGSINEAKKNGAYEKYEGSPASQGKLQFDLWEESDNTTIEKSGRWDWSVLKQEMSKYGLRNSLLTGLMPTASTAQIMGNSEAFEAVDSCIFKRRVLAGEFMVVNKYLVDDLNKIGLWNRDVKDLIIANNGSVQGLDIIPVELQKLYKTVWEISMKSVIEQSADRSVYIDQMQSLNLFMSSPTHKKLSSMLFYGFKHRLKSGIYYLRSRSQTSAGKFTIDPEIEKRLKNKKIETIKEEPEECLMCSS